VDAVLGTIGDDYAELITAHPADHVGGTHETVQTLAHGRDHRVGRLVAEGVGDHRELVDADGQVEPIDTVAPIVGDGVIDGLAQPRAVVVAGELVVVGLVLETGLVLLTAGDDAQCAGQALRLALSVQHHRAALVHPAILAVALTHAVLAVEGGAVVDMARQHTLAQQQVVLVDVALEVGTGANCRPGPVAEHATHLAVPVDQIGIEIPIIREVARRGHRRAEQRQFAIDLGGIAPVRVGAHVRPPASYGSASYLRTSLLATGPA